MSRVVRPYRDEDLDAVLSAWESASRVAHPFLTEAFLAQERDNIPNLYLPNAETWVLEHDGAVIGFIALIGNEVGAVFVKPECHGTGAGTALMDKARDLRGDLDVEVFEANAIGCRFYSSYGFAFSGRRLHEPTEQILLKLKFTAT